MTRHTTTGANHWTSRVRGTDADRQHAHGPLEPMACPSVLAAHWREIAGTIALCIGTLGLAVLAMVAGGVW